ncbi:MAG: DUF4105 domain-containing protein [Gemmatimonadetes bacterium]|nr:DUF4105 domain-containing protein [Gemmatimonadota bacterium]
MPYPLSTLRAVLARVFPALALGAAALLPVPAAAQGPASVPTAAAPTPGRIEPGAELTVYLLTMGQGDEVWEKFGHNAIWIHDPVRGTDQAYNYGMFDFRQENFVLRFVQGRMLYWMQGIPMDWTLPVYQRGNRSVTAQELNLTPRQRAELRDFLEWNESPENRFYRYDYYRDNCSTRVRDALDRVLGGRIRAETQAVPSGSSYRWHTDRLTADDVPIYAAITMGLGEPADRPISRWEEMFLPEKLHDQVARMRVRDAAGREVPLVASERVLVPSAREPERQAPPRRIPGFLLAGLALGSAFLLLARGAARSRAARYGFAGLAALWTLFVGSGGVILAGLWLFTDHQIAYRNENLFQLDPVALALVLLAPALAMGARWAARPAVAVSRIVVALAVLGLVAQVLPGLDQGNGIAIALALPAHLGLALALRRLAALPPSAGEAAPARHPARGRPAPVR